MATKTRAPRRELPNPYAKVCKVKKYENHWTKYRMKNISASGVGIYTVHLEVDDEVELQFDIMGVTIRCGGRVIRVDGQLCGIEFTNISIEDRTKIIKFIY